MRMCAAIWIAISQLAAPALAASCEDQSFEGVSYTVCHADPATETIRLFLNDTDGVPLYTFEKAAATLAPRQLAWAMNAGMYHTDRAPVGLYVEDGRMAARLVTRDGPGNFGLLPNGVLCLNESEAQVIESRSFSAQAKTCQHATQSGPMLVIDGKLHPRFLKNSTSVFTRNGVGVTAEGRLVAAISNEPVNFHSFARLFRDQLKTPNALFLDGNISRLYAPDLDRHDLGFPMGPILGVVVPPTPG